LRGRRYAVRADVRLPQARAVVTHNEERFILPHWTAQNSPELTTAGTGITVNSVLAGPTASEGVENFVDIRGKPALRGDQWRRAWGRRRSCPIDRLKPYTEPVELAQELTAYVASKLERKFGLQINREKPRVVDVRKQSMDFLGHMFRYDRPRQGRGHSRYPNVLPSKKALARERGEVADMIDTNQSHTPLPQLMARLSRHLEG
jgi:hypothetical protein